MTQTWQSADASVHKHLSGKWKLRGTEDEEDKPKVMLMDFGLDFTDLKSQCLLGLFHGQKLLNAWLLFWPFSLTRKRSGHKRVWCAQRTRGALKPGKRDRWYRRVNVQPQNPAFSGFPHKASILPWYTQPPSSSCTQMHVPPQLLVPLCLPGHLNVLSACPFMLWHNVACNSWLPLVLLHMLLTVSPLRMWCNIGVFSGSTEGGMGLQGIVFFLHPSFGFCPVEWLIKKKAPLHSFLPFQGLANVKAAPEWGGQKDTHVTHWGHLGSGSG